MNRTPQPSSFAALGAARLAAVLLLLAAFPLAAQTASADSLLAAVDRNQVYAASHSVGTITVEDKYGTKLSGFETWTQGADKTLLAFTSGEEKGQKILRLKDTIYLAYPEADKPVKIQGAALRDSVAGSDFSYEDMNGERGYAARYTSAIAGAETLGGVACTVLELTAKKAGLAYPFVRLWISQADGVVRQAEQYSQNRRLLKTQTITATMSAGGRQVASEVVMTDHLKGKSKTILKLSKLEIDPKLDAKLFSLEELSW
jgi:outer membrane lipoprotein-sorting protein